jgi:hypothetical protein
MKYLRLAQKSGGGGNFSPYTSSSFLSLNSILLFKKMSAKAFVKGGKTFSRFPPCLTKRRVHLVSSFVQVCVFKFLSTWNSENGFSLFRSKPYLIVQDAQFL